MKHLSLLTLLVIFNFSVTAQKIDFDGYYVDVEFTHLPQHYSNPANSTIQIHSTPNPAIGLDIQKNVVVHGFEFVDNDAQIDVYLKAYPLTKGGASPSSRTIEEKNKEGKITRRYNLYKVSSVNSCIMGSMNVYGPKSESKKELEKDKKKADKAKAEVEEANPFLTNAEDQKSLNEIKESDNKKKVFVKMVYPSFSYSTSESANSTLASEEYRLNSYQAFNNHQVQYSNFLSTIVKENLNNLYGFPAIKQNIKFQITDSEKHPEDKNYKNALHAIKIILAKLKYNEPSDEVKVELKPVIDYFISIKSKYTSTEKVERKFRHFTSLNLAKLYFNVV